MPRRFPAAPLQALGIFVSIIMAVGSSFAAMNTMYAAVARRANEIGTLRVLGFSRGSILFSFFLESLLLSVLGGLLGCLLVLPLNNVETGIGNFITFSEIAFNFRVSRADYGRGRDIRTVHGRGGRRLSGPHGRQERDPHRAPGNLVHGSRTERSENRPFGEAAPAGPSPWATRFIIIGFTLFALLSLGAFAWSKLNAATEVDTVRVHAVTAGGGAASDPVILNATGYIIAAHTIEVAAKVVGKVQWIGVEKGDHVNQGQVLVRLEDDEYRAQVLESQGQLDNLKAHLSELQNGSRPEEIEKAKADVEQAKADLENSEITLKRTKDLAQQGVLSKQNLDDAQAKYDANAAKVASLQRTYDLVKIGPRREEIEAARAQVAQAKGTLDYAKTQLDDTVITAPVTGTILDRNVEKGEFVTTGFVGDKGAKGYVVSLADLNDLQVELDINQNDFAKLGPRTRGVITTDAYPDRKYQGYIYEISPEANRQKATVQVKVKVAESGLLFAARDERERGFSGRSETGPGRRGAGERHGDHTRIGGPRQRGVHRRGRQKAVRRTVRISGTTAQGVQVESGLIGGEDLIVNPPAELKDGQRVRLKQS